MTTRRIFLQSSAAAAAALATGAWPARAANAPGITDTEIKIGQTMPYSGPASAYGVIGKTEAAYFKMINEAGGVNGRKINLISLDDGYSPPKTVEQIRRLVEQEQVAFIFHSLGTPCNAAIRQYLNDNKVPQLFVATGASMFSDPKHFPWTIGYQPNYQTEARIYGKHILADQARREDRRALSERRLRQGLSDRAEGRRSAPTTPACWSRKPPTRPPSRRSIRRSSRCKARAPTCSSSPRLRNSPRRRSARSTTSAGRPTRYLTDVSPSVATVLKPAGLEKSKGLITGLLRQGPDRRALEGRRGLEGMGRLLSTNTCRTDDLIDANAAYGFGAAATMVQVLEAVRQRPVAREHHEAGGQHQGSRIADAAARHEDQHLARPISSPIRQMQLASVQRRELGAVRGVDTGLKRTPTPSPQRRGGGDRGSPPVCPLAVGI